MVQTPRMIAGPWVVGSSYSTRSIVLGPSSVWWWCSSNVCGHHLFPWHNIHTLSEWSGINALLYYGPTLVRNIGLTGEKVTLLVAGGIGIVQALSVIPVILYLDQWGRWLLLLSSRTLIHHFQDASPFWKVANTLSFKFDYLTGCSSGGSVVMTASHCLIAILVS